MRERGRDREREGEREREREREVGLCVLLWECVNLHLIIFSPVEVAWDFVFLK